MGKTAKVVVCGMKGVGKTAVLEQVIYGNLTTKTVNYVNKYIVSKIKLYVFL